MATLLIVSLLSIAVIPIVCAIAAPFALRPGGRGRPIRVGIFLAVYLGTEIIGLLWATVLWLGLGIGGRRTTARYVEANYALIRRVLRWLYVSGTTLFNARIRFPDTIGEPATGPVLVLSRRSGPADSFLVIHGLLTHRMRNPRLVLSDTLQFDPLIDMVLSRVPHHFVDLTDPALEHGEDAAAIMGTLASDLGPRDAVVVFPESAAGVVAAMDAAPTADVVFVAHTGLDDMRSVSEIWQNIPLSAPVEATWSTVSATEIPTGAEAREAWLQDSWTTADRWVAERRRV